jgi:hypothetical protein
VSVVTNCILNLGVGAEDWLPQVNSFFEDKHGFVLLTTNCYGGTKVMETALALGAFNHLNLTALVDHLKAIDWNRHPVDPNQKSGCCEAVQLIVKEQEADRFRIIEIWEPKE